MKNPSRISTRLKWRCLKALLLFAALGLAALCALFSPAQGQSLQAMVKNQPFPYGSGVAMDSALYAAVRAKITAAGILKFTSEKAVADLQADIVRTRRAKDDLFLLQQYDAHRADSLTITMTVLQGKLRTAQADLTTAQEAIDDVLRVLPRRDRKALAGATPALIATGVVAYVHTLQRRKWKWLGAGTGIGALLAFALPAFL